MRKGLIHIYTGDGKGKTTASIGQAVRALGHGFKICFIYFHKNPKKFGSGELKILKDLGIDIYGFAEHHPYFDKDITFDEIRNECLKGIEFIEKTFNENKYDMLILDEINISLRDKFLKEKEVISLLKKKPRNLELILTGRGASKNILEKADLITEMKKIKHPYDQGIKGRKGMEY